MGALPKTTPTSTDSGTELDMSQAGTPEFEAEYRRQMLVIAEHDRSTRNGDRMQVHWDSLDSWE
jgi:hypothetical protein